jgi:TPP-dependent pyruvate/acetoin dehydrogenase alpha subunit
MDSGVASEAELNAIDSAIEERVDKSVELAEASPDPLPEDALKNVYWEGGNR